MIHTGGTVHTHTHVLTVSVWVFCGVCLEVLPTESGGRAVGQAGAPAPSRKNTSQSVVCVYSLYVYIFASVLAGAARDHC